MRTNQSICHRWQMDLDSTIIILLNCIYLHTLKAAVYIRNVNLNQPSPKQFKAVPGCHGLVKPCCNFSLSAAVKHYILRTGIFPAGVVFYYKALRYLGYIWVPGCRSPARLDISIPIKKALVLMCDCGNL